MVLKILLDIALVNRKIISKKSCVGKPSHRFLDSQKKVLENTGINRAKAFSINNSV